MIRLGLRIVATSGIAAVLGFSLATAARRTSVALGVLLIVFLFDMIMRQLTPGWTRWQFTENLNRFATGEGNLGSTRTVGSAGILLSIYAAGVFTAATLGFRHRDVT